MAEHYNVIEVDVSDLEAPQPLVKIMQALQMLDKNSYIKILHRIKPCRVYDIVKQKGLCEKTVQKNDGVIMYIYHCHQKRELWFLQD